MSSMDHHHRAMDFCLLLRCNVFEHCTLGVNLKLEDALCIKYLADFDAYLSVSQKPAAVNDGCNAALLVGLTEWLNFATEAQGVNHTLLTEIDIRALWALFSATAIAEGFSHASINSSESDDNKIQNVIIPNPDEIRLDFRHFGLLVLLQTRRPPASTRMQMYNRFVRGTSEVVYPNSAAAAHYKHAAHYTGGLVSPRNSPKHPSLPTTRQNSSGGSPFRTSESTENSPRTARALVAGSPVKSTADDIKSFCIAKLQLFLSVVHRNYTSSLSVLDSACVEFLSILLEPKQRHSSRKNTRMPSLETATNHHHTHLQSCLNFCLCAMGQSVADLLVPAAVKGNRGLKPFAVETVLSSSIRVDPLTHPVMTRMGTDTIGCSGSTSGRSSSTDNSGDNKIDGLHRYQHSHIITIENRRRETIYRLPWGELRAYSQRAVAVPDSMDLDRGSRVASFPAKTRDGVEHFISTRSLPVATALLSELTDCNVYILRSVRYAKIQSCRNCRIFLPVLEGGVVLSGCSNVQLCSVTRSIKVESCYETTLHVFTQTRPVLCGDTRGSLLGPFNAVYSKQRQLMKEARLVFSAPLSNLWSCPLVLSVGLTRAASASSCPVVSPIFLPSVATVGNSKTERFNAVPALKLPHAVTATDCSRDGVYSLVAPADFRVFIVPEPKEDFKTLQCDGMVGQMAGNPSNLSEVQPTKPFLCLPEVYAEAFKSQQRQIAETVGVMAGLSSIPHRDAAMRLLHDHFLSWLHQGGFTRELFDLSRLDVVCHESYPASNSQMLHGNTSSVRGPSCPLGPISPVQEPVLNAQVTSAPS